MALPSFFLAEWIQSPLDHHHPILSSSFMWTPVGFRLCPFLSAHGWTVSLNSFLNRPPLNAAPLQEDLMLIIAVKILGGLRRSACQSELCIVALHC